MPATSHFAPSDQLSTLLHPEKKKWWKRKAEVSMRGMWQKEKQESRGRGKITNV